MWHEMDNSVKEFLNAIWSVRDIVTIIQNTLLCYYNIKRHTVNQNHFKLILIIFTQYINTYINKTIIVLNL